MSQSKMAPGTAVSMKIVDTTDGGQVDGGGGGSVKGQANVCSCLLTPPDSAEIELKPTSTPPNFIKNNNDDYDDKGQTKIGDGPAVDTGTQTEYDPVVMEAKLIFLDIWNLVKSRTQGPTLRSSASKVMYRVAGQLLDKHAIIYASVVAKLNLVDDNERVDYFAFRVVCDEVLDDGQDRRVEHRGHEQHALPEVSWGRIVALYALFIQVARDCHRRGLDRAALIVADFVGIYVGERISPWITKQGGWGALERTFPAEDYVEQKVWKGLLVTGIGLGMLATAIKAMR